MEIQKQAEMLRTILTVDPDIGEIHLFFHTRRNDCVAAMELFWGADEPDRRYLAIDFDMRRNRTLSI